MNGLKYIMKLENMTTLEVAQRLKVNRSLISVWQTGRRKIPDNRINELIGIFPKYPAYYFNKDLTNEDMAIIRDIKINKKAVIKPQKDNRLNRAKSIVQEQINEYGRLLSDIAEILKIGDFSSILNNANYLSDKQMLTLFLTVVSSSQQRYLHDYHILNKLEYMKRNAEAHNIEDFKLCLIGVAMSALAAAYGIEDDVTTLSIPDKVRTMLPNEALNNDSDIKLFSEWKDRIVAVLKDIIDYCNERQKIINEMNEKLRRANMIIELLEDIIKEIPDCPNEDKIILMSKGHLIYDVIREHKDIIICMRKYCLHTADAMVWTALMWNFCLTMAIPAMKSRRCL